MSDEGREAGFVSGQSAIVSTAATALSWPPRGAFLKPPALRVVADFRIREAANAQRLSCYKRIVFEDLRRYGALRR